MKVEITKDSIITSILIRTIPIGETNYDKEVLENVSNLIDIVDECLNRLDEVGGMYAQHHEASIQDSACRANNYMRNLKEWFEEMSFEEECK
ncbi:hypothetical protein VPHG_00078 [Vibrio phage 11895-B1]|uniref:hypothetical protein n=1 Tax=Vibrio phage 11895-B1 TaxID=754075 RepID=UPI0002C0AF33|nr:hypothetical protein VPHG_00078 [Vibrio phage 11895-B1]AGH32145.1 hypothetical protein VPHG_00078 [Vibrio phage 11895-B1]